MSFLTCIFHLYRETSRKVGKLWSLWSSKTIQPIWVILSCVTGWQMDTAWGREPGIGQKKNLIPFVRSNIHTLCTKSCGGNMTHMKFWEQLIRDFVVLSHKENMKWMTFQGVESASQRLLSWPEVEHPLHCMAKRTTSDMSNEAPNQKTVYYCKKCDCGLCTVSCFKLWHTKTHNCDWNGVSVSNSVRCVTWSVATKQIVSSSSVECVMKLHLLWLKFCSSPSPHDNTQTITRDNAEYVVKLQVQLG
jgi:hypothetical protein